MVEPPQTDEGWYVLHDFRTIDWQRWQEAPERRRKLAIAEGREFFEGCEAVEDAPEGDSGIFSMLGHEADLLVVHFRPTLDDLSALERRFETTALAEFTERSTSYVSVTEVSGYVSDDYFDDDAEETNEGLRRYIEGKLKPEIPEDEYLCFYPMNKRRGEEYNWYALPFDERAELMEGHGKFGRKYAGDVSQVVASSVGLDDHEWGVTLFADDPVHLKDIVYEMRFDEASSLYGEFPYFYVGRRFPPADLGAFLEGEKVPTSEHDRGREGAHDEDEHEHAHEEEHGEARDDAEAAHEGGGGNEDDIRGELAEMDIYAGQPHGEDVYATVLYSEADEDELFEEVDGLRANFDHYDTHVKTAVYRGRERDRNAVVSIWETDSAAETAAGFLSELPDVVSRAGEESGFGTMGMFYTIKPEHRDAFVGKFDAIGELLDGMDGHQDTDLMVNVEDENDTFISSQWRSREDAMAFFRSDEFGDTVDWGRDVLADRPRHVFLA
ncbi:MAG: heme-binding protein [Haloferacaceae archaeon]